MKNSKINLKEQEEENGRIPENDNVTPDDDQLGENTEITPLGEELEKEDDDENLENDGEAAEHPAPDDDPQLDIETVSP